MIININAINNEVANQSNDPENVLDILRTGFRVHAASLV